jgi:Outer membrane protein beta-barrel domain
MEGKNDFDKLFGSNLPNFADKDWRNLEGQLDRHDLKKQFTRLLWALPALGGIMMTISGILYYQLNQTRQQVRSLEDRLVSVYENKKTLPEISPQKIVVQDTIYKQIVIRQTIRKIQTESPNLANNLNNIYYQKYGDNFTENQLVTEREKYIGINKLLGKNPTLNVPNLAVNTDLSKYKVIEFLEDSLEENNHFSLIPKSVTVGVLGGIQKPNSDEIESGGGREIGLRTVLGYNNSKGQERWGVVLDVQQSAMFFDKNGRSLNKNERDKLDKIVPPPGPRPNGTIPELKRVESPLHSSFQIGLGLRYNLLFSDKFKPYFGANWNVKIPYQYNKSIHYEDMNNPLTAPSDASTINMLGVNTGVNFLVSNKLSINSEVYYHSELSKTDNDASTVLGGRVGVSYRFGK